MGNMKRGFSLIIFLLIGACSKDTCEKSTVTHVLGCSYSHSGTDCYVVMKNGKWSLGGSPEVGSELCTKGWKGRM